MKQANKAQFEILSDVDCGIRLAGGIIFRMPKRQRPSLEAARISFAEHHGNTAWFLPIPATFIVDQDGLVAWRFVDVDFTHRAELADILQAVRHLAKRA
jgi:peroxiredoxin